MPPLEIEVHEIGIVVLGEELLPTPASLNAFEQLAQTEIVTSVGIALPNGAAPVPVQLRTLEMQKERVTLELAQLRSAIRRAYPQRQELRAFLEVARNVFVATGLEANLKITHGFNLEFVYSPETTLTATTYLAKHLFRDDLLGTDDWELQGGSANLTYISPEGRWNITLEPRNNDAQARRVYVALNLHKPDEPLPNTENMLLTFHFLWDKATAIANRLEERE